MAVNTPDDLQLMLNPARRDQLVGQKRLRAEAEVTKVEFAKQSVAKEEESRNAGFQVHLMDVKKEAEVRDANNEAAIASAQHPLATEAKAEAFSLVAVWTAVIDVAQGRVPSPAIDIFRVALTTASGPQGILASILNVLKDAAARTVAAVSSLVRGSFGLLSPRPAARLVDEEELQTGARSGPANQG